MADKELRLAAIGGVVRSERITTQGVLLARLAERGFAVEQSTLSRDLAELGISKRGGRYSFNGESPVGKPVPHVGGPGPHSIESGGIDYSAAAVASFTTCGPHLIVISTGVGQAQLVAVAIEERDEPSIAGTLAGDDTIFLATKTRRAQVVALRRLKSWFGDKQVV